MLSGGFDPANPRNCRSKVNQLISEAQREGAILPKWLSRVEKLACGSSWWRNMLFGRSEPRGTFGCGVKVSSNLLFRFIKARTSKIEILIVLAKFASVKL